MDGQGRIFYSLTSQPGAKKYSTISATGVSSTRLRAWLYAVSWGRYSSARAGASSGRMRSVLKSTMTRPCSVRKAQSTTPWSISSSSGSAAEDKELLAIFESTYGKVERRAFEPKRAPARTALDETRYNIKNQKTGPEYLLVDGYNIIFAWDELNALAKDSLEAARHKLMDILCNYQGYQKCNLILVFDAYRVPGSPGSIEQYHNIHIVYTKEAETADMFIEHVTHEIGKDRRVRVATSDGMEQIIILGHGALRVSARMFHEEVQDVEKEIRRCIQGEA